MTEQLSDNQTNRQHSRLQRRHKNAFNEQSPDILPLDQSEEFIHNADALRQSPDQILHLQNTIGNQGVQRLLNPDMPTPTEGDAFLASFSGSTAMRNAIPAESTQEQYDENGEIISSPHQGSMERRPLQRKETSDGNHAPAQPTNVMPFPSQSISPTQEGDIQRGPLAKKIGKHVGYGVLNMLAEQVIGPFADLKHVIRLGYYSRLKKGKTGQDLTDIEIKEDKVKDRVSEEWVGDYGGETWMAVIHAMSTTSEKLAVLAGAIALLATIASAFAPPAAVVATIAGIIGVSLTGLALIGRSILSIASLVKYKKATAGPDKERWKAMALGNLFKSISNVLGIVTFGIGAGVGGVDFSSVTKTGTDIGTDIGIGTAGALMDIGVSEIETPLQEKRLQREPEEEDESEAKAALMELDEVLGGVGAEMTDEKAAANTDKSNLQSSQSALGTVDSKLGALTEKTDEAKQKSQEAETELNNADSQAETPAESSVTSISKGEVKELETEVGQAEEAIENEQAPSTKPDVKKKKGFFSRIKSAVKKAGKKLSSGMKKLFGRLKSVFNRVKALLQKAKAKMMSMVLRIVGVSEDVAAAQEEVKDQKETQIPASMEAIDSQTATMDAIKESIEKGD